MQLMEEQIRRLQDEIQEIRKISSEKEFSTCQSGNKTEVRMISSEQIAQKENSRTAPVDMSSQHLNEASSSITSVLLPLWQVENSFSEEIFLIS